MSRPLRLEFSGALYHVTSRGNEKKPIFVDDVDFKIFLSLMAEVCQRFNWVIHSYCLMTNHYHLIVETPDGNLSRGMRHLNGVYTQRFNSKHKRVGHLFQGRYKAILVDKDSYLLELCRYVVLNPVRAKMVEAPGNWQWSSFLVTIIKSIAIFCFPMVYILYSCAEPVIAMVFGRGSFAQSDVIVVASVFQMLILSLPLLLIRDLLNRVIFAYESSSLSLIALLISVALHVIFVKYYMISYGLQGIAVGVAVSAFINSFILAVFLKLFFNVRLVVDSLKTIVICVASLVVSYLLSFLFASYVVLEW